MIIRSVKAEDVYGWLDIDVNFNKDLNLLYGKNGCGKTTLINIIESAFKLDCEDLVSINARRIEIVFIDNAGYDRKLEVQCNEGYVQIVIDEDVQKIPTARIKRSWIVDHDHQWREVSENFQDIQLSLNASKIYPPLKLGLDRSRDLLRSPRDEKNPRRNTREYTIRRINNIEMLAIHAYEKLRGEEKQWDDNLKAKIIASSFSTIDMDTIRSAGETGKVILEKVVARREEVSDCLKRIKINASDVEQKLDRYFEYLEFLNRQVSSLAEDDMFSLPQIELLLNYAQLDRISSIIDVISEDKARRENLYKPITMFLSHVNSFLEDSGKVLGIDSVGKPFISKASTNHDVRLPIANLSSGEKQIIIMFAYIMLGRFDDLSNVIMIDEPELSLHISWQERFVDSILSHSQNEQFIIATHSPEIVGCHEERCIEVK